MLDKILNEISKNHEKVLFKRDCIIFDNKIKYDTSKLNNTECNLIIKELAQKMGKPNIKSSQ